MLIRFALLLLPVLDYVRTDETTKRVANNGVIVRSTNNSLCLAVKVGDIHRWVRNHEEIEYYPIDVKKITENMQDMVFEWKARCTSPTILSYPGLEAACQKICVRVKKYQRAVMSATNSFRNGFTRNRRAGEIERQWTTEERINLTEGFELILTPLTAVQFARLTAGKPLGEVNEMLKRVMHLRDFANSTDLSKLSLEISRAKNLDNEVAILNLIGSVIEDTVKNSSEFNVISPLELSKFLWDLKRDLSQSYVNENSSIVTLKTNETTEDSFPLLLDLAESSNDTRYCLAITSNSVVERSTEMLRRRFKLTGGCPDCGLVVHSGRKKRMGFYWFASKALLLGKLAIHSVVWVAQAGIYAVSYIGMKLGVFSSATVSVLSNALAVRTLHIGAAAAGLTSLGFVSITTYAIYLKLSNRKKDEAISKSKHYQELLDKEIVDAFDKLGESVELTEAEFRRAGEMGNRDDFITTCVRLHAQYFESYEKIQSYLMMINLATTAEPRKPIEEIQIGPGLHIPSNIPMSELYKNRHMRRTASQVRVVFYIPLVSDDSLNLEMLAVIPQNGSQPVFTNGHITRYVARNATSGIKYAISEEEAETFIKFQEPLTDCDSAMWDGSSEASTTCPQSKFNWETNTVRMTDSLSLHYNPNAKSFFLTCDDEITEVSDPLVAAVNCSLLEFEEVSDERKVVKREAVEKKESSQKFKEIVETTLSDRVSDIIDFCSYVTVLLAVALSGVFCWRRSQNPTVVMLMVATFITIWTLLTGLPLSLAQELNETTIDDVEEQHIIPVVDDVKCHPIDPLYEQVIVEHVEREASSKFLIMRELNESVYNVYEACQEDKIKSSQIAKLCEQEITQVKKIARHMKTVYGELSLRSSHATEYRFLLQQQIDEFETALESLRTSAQQNRQDTIQLFTSATPREAENQVGGNDTTCDCGQKMEDWIVLAQISYSVKSLEAAAEKWRKELMTIVKRPLSTSEIAALKKLNNVMTVNEQELLRPVEIQHDDIAHQHLLRYRTHGLLGAPHSAAICVLRPEKTHKITFDRENSTLLQMGRYKATETGKLNGRWFFSKKENLTKLESTVISTKSNELAFKTERELGAIEEVRVVEDWTVIYFKMVLPQDRIICFVQESAQEELRQFSRIATRTDTFLLRNCRKASFDVTIKPSTSTPPSATRAPTHGEVFNPRVFSVKKVENMQGKLQDLKKILANREIESQTKGFSSRRLETKVRPEPRVARSHIPSDDLDENDDYFIGNDDFADHSVTYKVPNDTAWRLTLSKVQKTLNETRSTLTQTRALLAKSQEELTQAQNPPWKISETIIIITICLALILVLLFAIMTLKYRNNVVMLRTFKRADRRRSEEPKAAKTDV